ncbi:hypothetical protein [Microbispora bryophytorum]|uniref:hypothetical protein n=1 Tax=Microbispora bryophytorum TaxID=1460882 RepID=UPI0033F8999D
MADLVEDFEDTSYVATIGGTWTRTTTSPQSGSWCMRSPTTGNGSSSSMTVVVPANATAVRFWYRTSSEDSFDFFRFYTSTPNGSGSNYRFQASGNTGWTLSDTYTVTPGQTLTFRYTKDSSDSAGDDTVYVDNVTFTVPGPVRLSNSFDGGTNGATVTVGNSGGASGNAFGNVVGSPVYSSAQAHSGGRSAVNSVVGADCHVDWLNVTQPSDTICGRMYLKRFGNLTESEDAYAPVWAVIGPSGIVSKAWYRRPDSTLDVYTATGDTWILGTYVALVEAEWMRLEFRYVINGSGQGTVEVWTYSGDSTTVLDYQTSEIVTFPGGKPRDVEFNAVRYSQMYWHLDDVAVSDQLIGPVFTSITQPVNRVTEQGTARGILGRKVRAVGVAGTSEAADLVRPVKRLVVGRSAEADTAAAVAGRKERLLGQAVEANTAAVMRPAHARVVHGVGEFDAAREMEGLVGVAVRRAVEVDTALPIRGVKIRHFAPAFEVDTAAAVRPARGRTLGRAAETDTSALLGRVKIRPLGRVGELDTAGRLPTLRLGRSLEFDLAQPITPMLLRPRPMSAEPPRVAWSASPPRTRWAAGTPRT